MNLRPLEAIVSLFSISFLQSGLLMWQLCEMSVAVLVDGPEMLCVYMYSKNWNIFKVHFHGHVTWVKILLVLEQ
jgi:hypothetical protein